MTDRQWFHGTGEDQRLQLRREIQEGSVTGDQALFDNMFIGVTALQLMRGVMDFKQAPLVLAQMVADCELEIRQESMTMLGEFDSGSPAARAAHFNARVAAGIIGRLNEYIRRGQAAEEYVNQPEV